MKKNRHKCVQLRGQKLLDRIRICICEMSEAVDQTGGPFKLNQTRLAERVPCTRQTLHRYDDFIENVLSELGVRSKRRDGGAAIEALRDRIAGLKKRLNEKDRQIAALRDLHVRVFDQVMLHSMDVACLIQRAAKTPDGNCLICETAPLIDNHDKENIIPFLDKLPLRD